MVLSQLIELGVNGSISGALIVPLCLCSSRPQPNPNSIRELQMSTREISLGGRNSAVSPYKRIGSLRT